MFEELMNSKKMEDPEERKAKPIKRVKPEKSKFNSKKHSSVSLKTYKNTMKFVTFMVSVGAIIVLVVLAIYGIKLFIGG